MKVVINRCFGGFGLSDKAVELYGKKVGLNLIKGEETAYYSLWYIDTVSDETYFNDLVIERDDPALVEVVEELGEEANDGRASELKVVEIPDDVSWHIVEYDGIERVAENHRTWC